MLKGLSQIYGRLSPFSVASSPAEGWASLIILGSAYNPRLVGLSLDMLAVQGCREFSSFRIGSLEAVQFDDASAKLVYVILFGSV